jgi:hypothetical protein
MAALNICMTMLEASKDDFGYVPCISLVFSFSGWVRSGQSCRLAVCAKADAHVELCC